MSDSSRQRTFFTFLLLLILCVGVYARFTELGWHFINSDDLGVAEKILEDRASENPRLFPIADDWTYAPFQFVFTPHLINDNQTYRDLLFWSRLPSCIFSILGVILLAFFGMRYYKDSKYFALLPILFLACSWEAIIHAKQAHNYGIGSLAIVLIFYVLLRFIEEKEFKWWQLSFIGLWLGLASYMHYQALIFILAFFGVMFIFYMTEKVKLLEIIKRLGIVGGTFILCFIPLWIFFLGDKVMDGKGTPGSSFGPNKEFFLELPEGANLGKQIAYLFSYYFQNFKIVFQSNLSTISELHPWFEHYAVILFVFFIIGFLTVFVKQKKEQRFVKLYSIAVIGVWFLLIGLNKLNLSPTRHSYVFAPLMCIVLSDGVKFFSNLLQREKVRVGFVGVLVLGYLTLFLINYPVFLKERKDPFVEKEILAKLKEHNVGFLVGYQRNDGLFFMKSVVDYTSHQEATQKDPYKTVAWVGRSDLLFNEQKCEQLRNRYNFFQLEEMKRTKVEKKFIKFPCRDYRLIYQDRRPSDLQSDFSRKTQVPFYTKGFFFYIVRHIHN